ncbi:hypothetical protein TRFO_17854 [Tritrichomonas foetus]|uniref:Uncharacterized protein n=1 Tax=Tritrichomonas foetus TaxID=1144522 RepID=A0A1J4KMJ6_9EUKA|nr:hypothetical protein TRFO_17854 [Tritrichomonas foetus]|eukprot:OHT12370.1 hypothetical protein TRFO_17854 [Tritrichomonas foetus]
MRNLRSSASPRNTISHASIFQARQYSKFRKSYSLREKEGNYYRDAFDTSYERALDIQLFGGNPELLYLQPRTKPKNRNQYSTNSKSEQLDELYKKVTGDVPPASFQIKKNTPSNHANPSYLRFSNMMPNSSNSHSNTHSNSGSHKATQTSAHLSSHVQSNISLHSNSPQTANSGSHRSLHLSANSRQEEPTSSFHAFSNLHQESDSPVNIPDGQITSQIPPPIHIQFDGQYETHLNGHFDSPELPPQYIPHNISGNQSNDGNSTFQNIESPKTPTNLSFDIKPNFSDDLLNDDSNGSHSMMPELHASELMSTDNEMEEEEEKYQKLTDDDYQAMVTNLKTVAQNLKDVSSNFKTGSSSNTHSELNESKDNPPRREKIDISTPNRQMTRQSIEVSIAHSASSDFLPMVLNSADETDDDSDESIPKPNISSPAIQK